jgi:chemotaxis family two-component system sensor kinase Cph1
VLVVSEHHNAGNRFVAVCIDVYEVLNILNEKNNFLIACEQEKLHLSGAIQAFGALILTEENGLITHVSVNIDTICTSVIPGQFIEPRLAALGQDVGALVGNQKIASWQDTDFKGYILTTRLKDHGLIYEFYSSAPPLPLLKHRQFDTIETPSADSELASLQQNLLDYIAAATGFERVIYYQFMPNGDGEVSHESISSSHLGSYCGLRFPASDIPKIARDLYVLNPWRYIYDAPREPVSIVGITQSPPDLTYASLRSVSPVHVVYMQNMGVNTSISFPVILHGELVALITCHHSKPHQVDLPVLEGVSSAVQHYSVMQAAYLSQVKLNLLDGFNHWKTDTRIKLFSMIDDIHNWDDIAQWLMGSFSADGVILCVKDREWGYGSRPNDEAFSSIDDYFITSSIQIWSDHTLSQTFPKIFISPIAGLLGVSSSLNSDCLVRVFLFRNEHIESISWGGNPNKPLNLHDGMVGISPRVSFEKWVEKTVGKSKVWSKEHQLQALKLRELLLEVERYVQESGVI